MAHPKLGASAKVLMAVYTMAIRSLLEYRSVVLPLASRSSMNRLDDVQVRAARVILGVSGMTRESPPEAAKGQV